MHSVSGFDVYSLNFDESGSPTTGHEFEAFRQAASGTFTDAIFMAHGFLKNSSEASSVYLKFLNSFRDHLARPEFREIARRNYVVGAISWPSAPLPKTFGGAPTLPSQQLAALKELIPGKAPALDQAIALLPSLRNDAGAQDQFAALLLSVIDTATLDTTEGLQLIRCQKGSEILTRLMTPILLTSNVDQDFGTDVLADTSLPLSGSILDGVQKFLDLIAWFVMTDRAGALGAGMVARLVRATRAVNGSIQVHLLGHSLGGRLMAGCAKALTQTPMLQPDSLTLLQGAFSHYAFSGDNGSGIVGSFRNVISRNAVRGPLLVTFSEQDSVVGLPYAMLSRLSRENSVEAFGGIGRNGTLKTADSCFQTMKALGATSTPYIFRSGVVNCLDGSGGVIKNHNDVTNPAVTYAFASAVASTRAGGFISAVAG